MKKQICNSIDLTAPQTKRTQTKITPECAVQLLKDGNKRFVNKLTLRRDLKWQVQVTSNGQYPYACVLGCIDSRVSNELVFDQGIGDIFSTRIAGNFVNNDILGGIEFAYSSGVKLVLVLGHTSCGAVKGAIEHCGKKSDVPGCSHIVPMVKNICPAVESTKKIKDECASEYANRVAKTNVELTIDKIRKQSDCLRKAEENKEIIILGGMYNVSSGEVSFFEHKNS